MGNNNTKVLILIVFLIIVGGLIFLFLNSHTTNYQPLTTNSGVLVVKVFDGDTIEISSIGRPASGGEGTQRVRYLGVDTPETKDPRKPVQCFGKEAASKNKELVEGKRVFLEKDVTETDKYGRLLRFVYLPLEDGSRLFVNDYLIREGYGQVLTIPPDVKYGEQFLDAQKQAREQKKGLWEKC